MNLRRLTHFIALVDEGSFVAAARRLNLTQSALSHSIRQLEEELGLRLLDRDRSGTAPTGAGRALLADARDLVRRAEMLQRDAQAMARSGAGTVHFGFAPLPAFLYMGGLVAELSRDHPDVAMRGSVGPIAELLTRLKEDTLDFVICARFPVDAGEGLELRPFARLPMGFVVRAGHPLASGGRADADAIARYPLACIATDFSGMQGRIAAPAFRGGQISLLCDDCSVLFEATRQSDLVWATSTLVPDCFPGLLCEVDLALPGVEQDLELVIAVPAGRTLSPAAELVIARVQVLADR